MQYNTYSTLEHIMLIDWHSIFFSENCLSSLGWSSLGGPSANDNRPDKYMKFALLRVLRGRKIARAEHPYM